MNRRILLVDDEPVFDALFRKAIEITGLPYDFHWADSGEHALIWLGHQQDLHELTILMDVQMPGMSGIDTLHRIKDSNRLRSIPVVMFTGLDSSSAMRKTFEIGAVTYWAKPFGLEATKATLKLLDTMWDELTP